MKVTHEIVENEIVAVKVDGRLDAATVLDFEQFLRQLLEENRARLLINLSEVPYISSSGLRALLTARRQARAQGGDIVLCCLSPRVRQVFDMIGFSSVFGVYEDVSQAVRAFGVA